jgi:hypothetical protein
MARLEAREDGLWCIEADGAEWLHTPIGVDPPQSVVVGPTVQEQLNQIQQDQLIMMGAIAELGGLL